MKFTVFIWFFPLGFMVTCSEGSNMRLLESSYQNYKNLKCKDYVKS